MDYEKEYHLLLEENNKLKIEVDLHIKDKEVLSIENKKYFEKIKEASHITSLLPQDVISRKYFENFAKSMDEVKINEFLENSFYAKFLQNQDNVSIIDNKLYYDDKLLADIHDSRFSKLLEKIFKLLPLLVGLYIRYGHYSKLAEEISTYKFFGAGYLKGE